MFDFRTASLKVTRLKFQFYASQQSLCFSVRKLASESSNKVAVERSAWKVSVVSENNFPTKAGLASSASGYACLGNVKQNPNLGETCLNFYLVYTLARVFDMDCNSVELSALARRGSGSACRSLFGGFVRWYHDSQPCIAKPLMPADHWPEMRCLVAVVSSKTKAVGSTIGMKLSVETSPLLMHRVSQVVPERCVQMEKVCTLYNSPVVQFQLNADCRPFKKRISLLSLN